MAYNFGTTTNNIDLGENGTYSTVTPNEQLRSMFGESNISPIVKQALIQAAQKAGYSDFDFSKAVQAASDSAPSGGKGWLAGANPYTIANAILAATGDSKLTGLSTDPASAQYQQANALSQQNEQRDQDSHKNDGTSLSDVLQGMAFAWGIPLAAGAGMAALGGSSALGATGAATGAAAAGTPDAFLAMGGYGGLGGAAAGAAGAAGTGAAGMDLTDILGPDTYNLGGGGASGLGDLIPNTADYLPDGSSLLPGNPLNATAGPWDYVQGAIQSGNLDQLTKILPSLPTGAQSVIKAILGGSSGSNSGSILGALGKALPGLLGAYGANKQAGALSDLADKYFNVGAPSRARFEASMTPGFDPSTIPGYSGALDSASKAVMSRLSTQGNPYGNPGALIEANKAIVNGTALPAVQNYQSMNAAGGGLAALTGAVPGIAQQAIGSGTGGVGTGLGQAANAVFNPQSSTTLADLLKSLGGLSRLSGSSSYSLD